MSAGAPEVVYIGGLSADVTEDDVKAFAAKAGEVVGVPRFTKGRYAYVQFADAAAAAKAVAELNGQAGLPGVEAALVQASKPREERPPREPRKPKAAAAASSEEAPAEPRAESTTGIVVRGLPRDFDVEKLKELAGRSGAVASVRMDRRSRLGRITYESADDATKALGALTGSVDGMELKAERELERRKRPAKAPKPAASGEGSPAAEGEAPKEDGKGKKKKKAKKSKKAKSEGSSPAAAGAGEAAPKAEPPVGRRVRVAELTEAATPDHLKAHFASYGRIEDARIVSGRKLGFVTFDDAESATKALGADGSSLNGNTIAVTMDESRAPNERGAGRRRKADDEDAEAAPAAPKPERTLYIGGLKDGVHTEAVLRGAVAKFGDIESVEVARRGTFAYVKFATEAAVAAAVAGLEGAEIEGTVVKAAEATNPSPRSNRVRPSRKARAGAGEAAAAAPAEGSA